MRARDALRGNVSDVDQAISHHSHDGRLYEMLDEDGPVELTVTVESLAASWEAMRGATAG